MMKNIDLGFDTIGNATMICYDKAPILVTDPWITGSAYFGSWGLSHEIPEEQYEAILKTKYVWYSHGHPDHLNWDSLGLFKDKQILLPDHYGKRIYDGLKQDNFNVTILKDKVWYPLSEKIRIMCFSDIYQDAVILIDINGRLVVNTNDANRLLVWNKAVKRVIKQFDKTFLLALTGHGDAEMINFRDDQGELILPPELIQKNPLSSLISNNLNFFGIKAFIPFSSLHRYQRTDSIWAEEASVKMEEYTEAHLKDAARAFPPFIRYNCIDDTYEEIKPKKNESVVYEPEYFGDNWSDLLEKSDVEKINTYFNKVEVLKDYWDFIVFKVGGKEHVIELKKNAFKTGIKFEAPKNSLMFSVENNIFEDMLIGNFMRTSWVGKDPLSRLYPDTLPLVKYADNGLSYTKEEIEKYLSEYSRRYPFDTLMDNFQKKCGGVLRKILPEESNAYSLIRSGVKKIIK